MNMEDKNVELARKYLAQDSLAFREWYRDYKSQETGIPGTEVSFPNLEKIEQTFDEWYEQSRSELFHLICTEWGYCEKKTKPEFQTSVSFVIALTDFFIAQHTNFPSPLAVSALLVLKGLDKLCGC